MPNSTRRRVGHRAASPANMHENTRSRTATASGGTPSLAREEADDEAAALIRQADGDTTGAALTSSPPRNPDSESDDGSDSSDSPTCRRSLLHRRNLRKFHRRPGHRGVRVRAQRGVASGVIPTTGFG